MNSCAKMVFVFNLSGIPKAVALASNAALVG